MLTNSTRFITLTNTDWDSQSHVLGFHIYKNTIQSILYILVDIYCGSNFALNDIYFHLVSFHTLMIYDALKILFILGIKLNTFKFIFFTFSVTNVRAYGSPVLFTASITLVTNSNNKY